MNWQKININIEKRTLVNFFRQKLKKSKKKIYFIVGSKDLQASKRNRPIDLKFYLIVSMVHEIFLREMDQGLNYSKLVFMFRFPWSWVFQKYHIYSVFFSWNSLFIGQNTNVHGSFKLHSRIIYTNFILFSCKRTSDFESGCIYTKYK